MGDSLVIRPATADDHSAFAALFPELGVDDPIPAPARFTTEMVATTVLATDGDSVLGYAYWVPLKDMTHLSQIVVAKEARRRGVGRALMKTVADGARAAGSSVLTLNVVPHNAAAVALYESFGLERVYESKALRISWAKVDALAADATPSAGHARRIEPTDDDAVEQALNIVPGTLADARSKPSRVLILIEAQGRPSAAAVFDQNFPGAYPFKARDVESALSLLRALRPHARAEDTFVNLVLQDQPIIAEALRAHGATLRLETVHMRGRLRP